MPSPQTDVKAIPLEDYMKSLAFRTGMSDYKAGRWVAPEIFGTKEFEYECGRQFAACFPTFSPNTLVKNGRVSTFAMMCLSKAMINKWILA